MCLSLPGCSAARQPPPVGLHPLRGVDELLLQRVVVLVREVHAAQTAPGADPAQRHALGPEVVLQQPVVAAGLREEHRPHRLQVGHPDRAATASASRRLVVRTHCAAPLVHLLVQPGRGRLDRPAQELVHGAHHHRVRGERADHVRDAHRALGVEALHQRFLAAHHADRHAAGHRLAVHHHVGPNAEVLLGPARRQPEARVHLVEDERDAVLGADRPELAQPLGVARSVVARSRRMPLVIMIASLGGGALGWNDCTGFTSTPAISPARRRMAASEAGWRSFSVRQSSSVRSLPRPGLHAVPPAVIGAREADDELPARVEPRQPHGRHDRLGAAHVEGDLVQLRDRPEQRDVLGDDRVERPQHRTEIPHALQAPGHPVLVAPEAGDVDPVRAAHVERPVPVEVGRSRAVGRRDHGARIEVLPHEPREGKGHAVGVGEAQVREALAERASPGARLRVVRAEELGQPLDPQPAPPDPGLPGAVRPEEVRRPSSRASPPIAPGGGPAPASAPAPAGSGGP